MSHWPRQRCERPSPFLMRDDPLVHFDNARLGVAVDVLLAFSANTQVVIFTCHDHQAEPMTGDESCADQADFVLAALG
jgi:uncharacterized protein YhaN